MSTTIPTYRYQYRQSSSSTHLPSSRFSLSPPRNTLPHSYLESPTSILSSPSLTLSQPGEKIIIRQVGGPDDNHAQWASVSDLVPYHPSQPAQPVQPARNPDPNGDRQPVHKKPLPSSPAVNPNQNRVHTHHHQTNPSDNNNENGTDDDSGGKRRPFRSNLKRLESGVSKVRGVVHTANWVNDVGDTLWLRSNQPIIRGRRSVPVMNLDKGVSAEVSISHATWCPSKRDLTTNSTTITFIGAEYYHSQGHRHGGEQFRMCILQDDNSYVDGDIETIPVEELEPCFEDVDVDEPVDESVATKVAQGQQRIPLSRGSQSLQGQQRPKGPRPMPIPPTLSLPPELGPALPSEPVPPRNANTHCLENGLSEKGLSILGESGGMNDDDDTLSQASFASSTKSKVALDLVAQSLSIFNFNAAMLDLAALANQSTISGLIRNVDERPEASEDNDSNEEDEDGEGEEKVWSDCEPVQSEGRRVEVDDEECERSRVKGSGMRVVRMYKVSEVTG